ncbi:P-loop containing nucleoside triphosphate hydrolase protein [Entophlyctis helioformis]|nr:P-loop containing nucleoside triphosphate hydrolase protein [Entophlyctis helioformis]
MGDREAIKVIVRCRPFSEKESAAGHTNIIQIDKDAASVTIIDPRAQRESGGDPPKTFTFDSVFDITSRQMEVYDKTARQIVDCVLQGYNGTVFAYGQTGTGKTFSMEGIRDVPELRGIIPNAFEQIFSYIKMAGSTTQFLVRASYLEIYNEEIRDLLNPKSKKLDIKERPDTGVYVKDLSTFVIKDIEEMDRLMSVGNKNRSVGYTDMNATSSRSHSIFTITVEASETENGEEKLRAGKLHLVDLAGSERQSKTGATGDRLKEATKINLSLSALGNVISALVDGKSSHIPYRDSKLTRLLQDSLGGNAKTLMVATMSPASYNYDETLSTLRYANRAKSIKNKPKVNEDPKDAMLREFQEEIKRLKKLLESEGGDAGEIVQEVEEIEEIEEVEEIEVDAEEDDDDAEVVDPGSSAAAAATAKQAAASAATPAAKKVAQAQPPAVAKSGAPAAPTKAKTPRKEKTASATAASAEGGADGQAASKTATDKAAKAVKVKKPKRAADGAAAPVAAAGAGTAAGSPDAKTASLAATGAQGSDAALNATGRRSRAGVSEAELQAMKDQVEQEKAAILASKDMEESERNRLLAEAEARLQDLTNERAARDEIAAKLAQLEQKLLVGGVNIIDQHESQKMMLAKRAQELEERARKHRELQRELEVHDEANLQIEEEFTNLQEEAAAKTRKLKRLWSMVQEQKSELKDVQGELQREREDLLETIRELTRELKLRTLVMNGFIPVEEQHIIEDSAEYDEAAEKWRVAHIAHAGNNIRGKRSLVSGEIQNPAGVKGLGGKDRGKKEVSHLHRNHMVGAGGSAGAQGDDPVWDPMCVFPDLFLTYDVPGLKKKDGKRSGTGSNLKAKSSGQVKMKKGGSSTGAGGSGMAGAGGVGNGGSSSSVNMGLNSSSGGMSMSGGDRSGSNSGGGGGMSGGPGSQPSSRSSPTKGMDRSSGGGASGGSVAGNVGSSQGNLDSSGSSAASAIPVARGLVGKNKHYA